MKVRKTLAGQEKRTSLNHIVLFFFIIILTTSHPIKINKSANAKAINNSSEPAKNIVAASISPHATSCPKAIASAHCHILRFVSPPIKLPDQTPVSGSGIATNPPSKNSFLSVLLVDEILPSLLEKWSCKKPVKKRFLILRVKKTTGKIGRMLPT